MSDIEMERERERERERKREREGGGRAIFSLKRKVLLSLFSDQTGIKLSRSC